MTWMVRLYPRRWRRRYGAELEDLVRAQPKSLQLAIDLLGGAIDAHLNAKNFSLRFDDETDHTKERLDMISRIKRCEARADLSTRDATIAAGISIGGALLIAAFLMVNDSDTAETIVLTMSPGVYIIGAQWFYLRGHSLPARLSLIGAPLVVLFLIGLGAAVIRNGIAS